MAAAGTAVAADAEDGPAATRPSAGLRRDLVAGANRLALAGRAQALRSVGDRVPLFRRRQIDGTWATVLQVAAEAAGHIEWEASVDSTVCRAHQHAAGAREKRAHGPGRASANGVAPEPDDHALGRSRGGLNCVINVVRSVNGACSCWQGVP